MTSGQIERVPPVVQRWERATESRRPLRVLMCPDQPDWAFHNIARNVERYAPDGFEISVHFMGKPGERDLATLVETMLLQDIDVVHAFWREDMFEILRPETLIDIAGRLRLEVNELIRMISTRALTTSIYDHLHSSEESVHERAASFHLIDGYSVCSRKLHTLYCSRTALPRPDAVIPDGVDLEMFRPSATRTEANEASPLRIGWVGNSAWGRSQGGDPKGFFRLFQPAMDALTNRGVPIDVYIADPQVARVPFAEMPRFYQQIDVLVCTSAMEGTPNPVLEAMASGIAVVSTDVGLVPELLRGIQARFILKDSAPASLAAALEHLASDREQLRKLGLTNRASIAGWSWENAVRGWWPFWSTAKRNASDRRLSGRRYQALAQSCTAHFNYLEVTSKRHRQSGSALQRGLGLLKRR